MSRNPSPVSEQIEEQHPMYMKTFYEGRLTSEELNLLFGKLDITANFASRLFLELFEKAKQDKAHGSADRKVISFIKAIKPHLDDEDYIRAIMIPESSIMDSSMHMFALKRSVPLTAFILDELLELIINRKINGQQIEQILTRQKNHSTSFLLICRMGNEACYLKFFNVLIAAREHNLMDNQVIQSIITTHDYHDFNPLHMLLNNGNLEMINHFLCAIVIYYSQNVLTQAHYKYLLTAETRDGYNPLHDAIKLNDGMLLKNILSLNIRSVELGISNPEDFRKLITSKCKGGFNPLQKIYLSENVDLLNHFIVAIHEASLKGIIEPIQTLKVCYLNINNGNFSVYFDAVGSGNEALILNHIAILRTLLRLEIINTDDYKNQLSKPNQQGFNVFLKALETKKPEVIQHLFEDIRQLFSQQELSLMVSATFNRFGTAIQKNIFNSTPQIKAQTMQFVMQNCSLETIHQLMHHSSSHQFFRTQTPCNSPKYQGPSK